jgi:tRNA A37 threonylcarbamoyladenosine dehydratase
MAGDYEQRFGGIARLYGAAGLKRLRVARVAVVGVGGVGSWVVEALARSGIGGLTLIDLDDVCVTNINRQLPALSDTVGKPKVSVLRERALAIHPGCDARAVPEFLSAANATRLLGADLDLVVDAVDAAPVKAVILDHCRRGGIPVVCSGAAGGRRDPGKIKTADLSAAGGDPLLGRVRKLLRRDHGWPGGDPVSGKVGTMGVPCVFSSEKPYFPLADGGCSREPGEETAQGLKLDCAEGFGAAAFVTGAFGFALAAECVRILTGE